MFRCVSVGLLSQLCLTILAVLSIKKKCCVTQVSCETLSMALQFKPSEDTLALIQPLAKHLLHTKWQLYLGVIYSVCEWQCDL